MLSEPLRHRTADRWPLASRQLITAMLLARCDDPEHDEQLGMGERASARSFPRVFISDLPGPGSPLRGGPDCRARMQPQAADGHAAAPSNSLAVASRSRLASG